MAGVAHWSPVRRAGSAGRLPAPSRSVARPSPFTVCGPVTRSSNRRRCARLYAGEYGGDRRPRRAGMPRCCSGDIIRNRCAGHRDRQRLGPGAASLVKVPESGRCSRCRSTSRRTSPSSTYPAMQQRQGRLISVGSVQEVRPRRHADLCGQQAALGTRSQSG